MKRSNQEEHGGERDRRFVKGQIELRADKGANSGKKMIVGRGIVYDVETQIGGSIYGFREIIARGAFTKSLTVEDQRSLFNHDPNLILGRRSAETLRLIEDEQGVGYEVDPPNTSYANDLVESLARRDVTGSSFVFTVSKEEWTWPQDGSEDLPLRRVLEGEIYELGPVTFPAYETSEASVAARGKVQEFSEARAKRSKAPAPAAEPPAPADVPAAPVVEDAAIGVAAARAKALQLRARVAAL